MGFLARLALRLAAAARLWPSRDQRLRFQLAATGAAVDLFLVSGHETEAFDVTEWHLALAREVHGNDPEGLDGAAYMARRATLGAMLDQNCHAAKGAELLEESIHWFRTHSAQEHSIWASCLLNIGAVLLQLNRPAEALEWLDAAKSMKLRLLGEDSFELAPCHNDLSIAYQDLGRFEESEAATREALRLHEKHVGKNSEGVQIALNNLAATLMKSGRLEEAQATAARAISMAQAENSELMGDFLDTLADIYEAQGRTQEALLTRGRALERGLAQQKIAKLIEWGEKHLSLLERAGRAEEAGECRAVLDGWKRAAFHRHAPRQVQVT